MPGQYWLVSVPLENGPSSASRTWDTLLDRTSRQALPLSQTYRFSIPELRVGTLDSLLHLSDDLSKATQLIEAVTHKIYRQLVDFKRVESIADLTVDGTPVERYLFNFQWNEAKFPARRPLRETVEKISEATARLEDELKMKLAEYNTVKGQLSAFSRKQGGSLAVRDLSDIVQRVRTVDSENLTTLLVAVPKHQAPDWWSSYERLAQYVVPRSSRMVLEEGDFQLFTVTLFKRTVDAFKTASREKGFQVRDVNNDPAAVEAQQQETRTLERDAKERKANLEEWCGTSYGEAFQALMHVYAVRLFVESVLRYGLPPCFVAAVVKPMPKVEKRLRQVLDQTFGQKASSHWKEDAENAGKGTEEIHTYVSFNLDVTHH